jgi:magnesium chelatase family protein
MATQGCPCGFLGHPRKPCKCTPRQVQLYCARLSGPLLDRIDMHVEVPAVTARELTRGVRRRRVIVDGSMARSPECGSFAGEGEPESSASVRTRVMAARHVQERRFSSRERTAGPSDAPRADGQDGLASIHCNAQMGIREIEALCRIDDATGALLHKAMETRSMSARAVHRVLRVARTIADLAGVDALGLEHVAEAVQYQSLPDRSGS